MHNFFFRQKIFSLKIYRSLTISFNCFAQKFFNESIRNVYFLITVPFQLQFFQRIHFFTRQHCSNFKEIKYILTHHTNLMITKLEISNNFKVQRYIPECGKLNFLFEKIIFSTITTLCMKLLQIFIHTRYLSNLSNLSNLSKFSNSWKRLRLIEKWRWLM